jgi:hypothetical protein
MPQFAVEVHPLAADEAEAAERWYRDRNETASTRFRRELDRLHKCKYRRLHAPATTFKPHRLLRISTS